MKSYICKTCGANLILNDTKQTFTKCLYCGNNIVISDKIVDSLNVKKIIPFSVDKNYVLDRMKKEFNIDVIESKKVYVPVRFCSFEFDYMYYFTHRIKGGEDYTYIDVNDIYDVKVNNEIIFGNSKVKNLISLKELKEQISIDYDPVIIDDVSIENASFDTENTKKELDFIINHYLYNKYKSLDIITVYNNNYSIYDTKIDDYSTLIPVYILKGANGCIYELPGIPKSTNNKKDLEIKKRKARSLIFNILEIIFGLIFLYLLVTKKITNIPYYYIIITFMFPVSLMLVCVGATNMLNGLSKSEPPRNNRYDNYECRKIDKEQKKYKMIIK